MPVANTIKLKVIKAKPEVFLIIFKRFSRLASIPASKVIKMIDVILTTGEISIKISSGINPRMGPTIIPKNNSQTKSGILVLL
jgi:hypothetical protein